MPKQQSSRLSERKVKTVRKPAKPSEEKAKPVEVGGPKGPEPTRYGDWEKAGRCTDF